jgi:hypothetical protein
MGQTCTRILRTLFCGRFGYLGLCVVLVAVSLAQENRPGAIATDPESKAKRARHRVREGEVLTDMVGFFKMTGERATFYSIDKRHRLMALENLNLQRVAEVISVEPEQLQWTVSGTVTEYQGSNYLLLRRVSVNKKIVAPRN